MSIHFRLYYYDDQLSYTYSHTARWCKTRGKSTKQWKEMVWFDIHVVYVVEHTFHDLILFHAIFCLALLMHWFFYVYIYIVCKPYIHTELCDTSDAALLSLPFISPHLFHFRLDRWSEVNLAQEKDSKAASLIARLVRCMYCPSILLLCRCRVCGCMFMYLFRQPLHLWFRLS